MTAFRTLSDLNDAYVSGRVHTCSFRKVFTTAITAGWWHDISVLAGNPLPNYYAATPLVAEVLNGDRGLFHGPDQSPATKWISKLGIVASTAAMIGQYKLLDYLLYYPFVDSDVTDEQILDNTTTLPRYSDGAGVQVMAVVVGTTSVINGTFTFDYVNQDGVTRTSPVQGTAGAVANFGNLYCSAPASNVNISGPFLKLASGDTGVRSITSVTYIVPTGGLITLVLVKPLMDTLTVELNVPYETSVCLNKPITPILDGAYLNLIVRPTASVTIATIAGYAEFVWSE